MNELQGNENTFNQYCRAENICFRSSSGLYGVSAPTVAKKPLNLPYVLKNRIHFGKFVTLALNILFIYCFRGE